MRRTRLLPLLATTLLLAACTSDKPSTATPPPSPTMISEDAQTAATPTRTPTSETYVPLEPIEVLATVWLIDLRDGAVVTLAEDAEDYPASATFNLAGLPALEYWRPDRTLELFDLDGTPLGSDISDYACQTVDEETIRIRDRTYEGIGCGLVSPDRRWMLYATDAGTYEPTPGYEAPVWDQWLLDLETDERTLLHEGMRHCGGCDGRFGPAWSPTGRYVFFPELIQDGEVFLTETETLETRLLASSDSATDIKYRPVWSPAADRLLHAADDGSTLLEDLEAGATVTLTDVPWPAWFDATGAYIYTPAYEGERLPSSPRETRIFDAATGELVATREGVPSPLRALGAGGDPIVAIADGFVAALEGVVDCRGTTIYPPNDDEGFCVADAYGAAISPDGSQVALAVRTQEVRAHIVPGDLAGARWLNNIIVVDLATGATRTVATDAVSDQPPKIEWNSGSTHVLVRWPAWFGV